MEEDKLINQTVIHKTFGKGMISSANEKYLEVSFAGREKISKFAYPSCFYSFLIFEDKDLQREIDAVVEVWKQENGAVEKEELRHKYEKTMKDIYKRHLESEEKKLKAAQKAMERRSIYGNGKHGK